VGQTARNSLTADLVVAVAEALTELPALHPDVAVHGDAGVLPCNCFARREGR
jgi:hypothetical protein